MAGLAATIVAAGRVDAHGALATGQTGALVYVEALHVRVAVEARRTHTIDLVEALAALGGHATRVRFALGLLLGTTALVGVATRSHIAHTLVAAEAVLAVGVVAALGMAVGRDRWRHTQQVWVADKRRLAGTLARVGVAIGADSAHHSIATVLATATDAHLGRCARLLGRALIGDTGAAGEGVTVLSWGTFAGGATVRDDAEGTLTAKISLAFCEKEKNKL